MSMKFIHLLWFANIFLPSAVLHLTRELRFPQWVDPPTIDLYEEYIDYLEDVVIDNLKRQLHRLA
jgi:hypothetical protein